MLHNRQPAARCPAAITDASPGLGDWSRGREPRPRAVGVVGASPSLGQPTSRATTPSSMGGDIPAGVGGDDSDGDGGGRSRGAGERRGLTGGGAGAEQMDRLCLVLEKSDMLEEIAVVIREPDKVLSLRV